MKSKIISLVLLAGLLVSPIGIALAKSDKGNDITICHQTGSEHNPYVSQKKQDSKIADGDGISDGDIIPPFTYGDEQQYAGQNWTEANQAIWNNECEIPFVVTPVPVLGCTDSTATNFNSLANQDDGSCEYPIVSVPVLGCTDSNATNFNPLATQDDGSCIQPVNNGGGDGEGNGGGGNDNGGGSNNSKGHSNSGGISSGSYPEMVFKYERDLKKGEIISQIIGLLQQIILKISK